MTTACAGRYAGRTVLVTGAGSGIGRTIAERAAAEGADVVLCGLDESACSAVAQTIRTRYGTAAVALGADLSRSGEAERMRAQALERFGKIDVLINNAGGGVIMPSLEHTEATLQRTIDNNLWTTLRCTLAAIPPMQQRGYGRVVNVGAESVRNGLDGHAVYNAAKGGVHAMMSGFAREFATAGLTFNTVAPSWVLIEQADERKGPPEALTAVRKRALDLIPMGRPGTSGDVAAAVLFLASEEAGFITGQVLSVNGGSSMQ
jgi:2,3-dihydroxy-2,3-dihydro-p-cumate dehydrogenase